MIGLRLTVLGLTAVEDLEVQSVDALKLLLSLVSLLLQLQIVLSQLINLQFLLVDDEVVLGFFT